MDEAHIRVETNKESIVVKIDVVISTHKYAIARFVCWVAFGLARDPVALLKVGPLSRVSFRIRETQIHLGFTVFGSDCPIIWQY